MPGTSGPDAPVVVVVGFGLGFGAVVVVARGPVVATVWTSVVGPVVIVGPVVAVVGSVEVVEPSPGFGCRLPVWSSTGGRRVSGTRATAAEATTTATAAATTTTRLRPARTGTSSPSPGVASSPPRRLNTAPGYEPPPCRGPGPGPAGGGLSE